MTANQNPKQLGCAPADELGLDFWLVSACAGAPLALCVADVLDLHLVCCDFAGFLKGVSPSFVCLIRFCDRGVSGQQRKRPSRPLPKCQLPCQICIVSPPGPFPVLNFAIVAGRSDPECPKPRVYKLCYFLAWKPKATCNSIVPTGMTLSLARSWIFKSL